MKKILSLTLVLLLVFSMMPMAAFADSTATVTFKLLSDGPCAELTVLLGETVEEPIDPEIFGCRFEGWYMDAGYTTPYDFDAAVTDDITLHAKWSSKPGYLLDWFENVPAGLGRMLELSEAESLDEFWSYLTDNKDFIPFGSTDYSDLVSDLDLVNIAFYISLVKCAGILLRNEDDFTKARDYEEVEALFKSMILFDDAAKLIEVLEQNDAGKTFMCVLEIYPDFISGINKIDEEDLEPLEEPEEEDPSAWPSYEERLFENICSAAEWGDELFFPGDLNSGLTAILMGWEFDDYYTSWIFDEELHAYDNFFASIKDICDTIAGFADPSDADIFLISEDNVNKLKKVAYPLIRLILSSVFDYSNSAYQKYILGKVSVIGTCIGDLMDAARFDEAQNEEMNNSEPPLEEYYYETPNTNLTLLDVVYAYYHVLVDYFNSGDPAPAGELTANEQAFKEYYEGAAPDLCHAEIIGDFEPSYYNGYVVNGIELGSICIDYVDWEDESKGYYAYIEESTEDDYIYHYLGAADGKLVYLEEPYVWSLKNGALCITETVEKTIKGFRIGLFKIPSRTVTTSTTYYLSTLTEGETLSTDPIETKYISRWVSSGHNYNCIDLGDGTHVNVCSDCGKQKGSPEAHEYSYLMDNFDGTHSWVCSECYAKITKEAHSYDPETHQCECGTIDPSYIAQQLAEEMRRAAEEALRKAAEEAKRVAEEALRKAAEEAKQAAEEVARAAEEAVKQAAEETARIAEETAKAVTNKAVKDTVTVSRGLGNVAQIILAGVVKALGRVF